MNGLNIDTEIPKVLNLRRIANWAVADDGNLLIDILAPLNKECLQGITDWCHCWVVYVADTLLVEAIVAKIESQSDRRLSVLPASNLPSTAKIVDIKPYHFLEALAT